MLIDVVIPAYNASRYIRETVESIASQALPERSSMKIWIVDDGSEDDTSHIAASLASQVSLLTTQRVGNVAARNAALRHCRGDFVAFCDADDVWEPGKLMAQLAGLRESGATASCTALTQISAQGDRLSIKGTSWTRQGVNDLLLKDFVMPVPLSSWMIARDLLGYLDETLPVGADLEMALRVASHGAIDFVPSPLIRYRIHGASISADRAREQQHVRRYLRERHAGAPSMGYGAWRAQYKATFAERAADHGVLQFRKAGQSLSDGRRLSAIGHAMASLLLSPREFRRKVLALRR